MHRAALLSSLNPMGLDFERVEVKSLVKMYGATRALVGVNAEFLSGRVTVVEGPNGSGKSTLLNILGGLVRPTRGKVFYGEESGAHRAELRAQIGVLAHAPMIYPDLSARENLALYLRLYRTPQAEGALEGLLERFAIGRWGDRPARTYSRGQLQRVALARALLHSPRLLLLDEPSTGLDTKAVERLIETVDAERKRGAIVVLITHDGSLADQLADDRVELSRGKVVA